MRRSIVPLAFVLLTVACADGADEVASDPAPSTSTTSTSTTTTTSTTTATVAPLDPAGGVDGPLVYQRDGLNEAEDAGLFGHLRLDGDCLVSGGLEPGVDTVPLLFPFGSTWDPDRQAVTSPEGVTVRVGERFATGGGHHATDQIDHWVESPTAIEALQGCGPSAFVISHPVTSHALDPAGGVDRPWGSRDALIYTAECEGCPGEEALGRFELTAVDGCLTGGDDHVLVWPFGTTWNPVRQQVELPDGTAIGLGERFEAGGGFHGDLTGFADSVEADEELAACGGGAFVIQSPPSLGWDEP